MESDVFISYSSKDKPYADAVCARLEQRGIRCWIAPRDVIPGMAYGEAIIDAIHDCRLMVLVFSSNANTSNHIAKEVERAVSQGKPIVPFRIENVMPGRSLDYFIGSVHWLDAITPPFEQHLDNLATTVLKLMPPSKEKIIVGAEAAAAPIATALPAKTQTVPAAGAAAPNTTAARTAAGAAETAVRQQSRTGLWVGVAVAALLLVMLAGGVVGWFVNGKTDNTPAKKDSGDALVDPSPAAASGGSSKGAIAPGVIAGCWQWFNNAMITIRPDGTMTAGPFNGRWQLVDGGRRMYRFTWPEPVDTVAIYPDGSLRGGNQFGYPTSGTRVSGGPGLVGSWRWSNGATVTVNRNGTFTGGPFSGTWVATDASQRGFQMTWPKSQDTVTLSADYQRISGSNQYGVAISGTRRAGGCGL